MNIAMIIAGGVGSRTGQSIPKQFLTVNEKPIFIYVLEKFQRCEEIDEIYVAVREEYHAITADYINQYKITKVRELVQAGASRNKSIVNALEKIREKHAENDKIIIHHANMPFVSQETITKILSAVNTKNISFAAAPQFDYMFKSEQKIKVIDRENVWQARVPEAMTLKNAREIYTVRMVEKESKPAIAVCEDDDCTEWNMIMVQCSGVNFKITTYDDFKIARAMILSNDFEI